MWTSLDIGIKFDKPTNIRSQLDKIANGGAPRAPSQPADNSTGPSRQPSLVREAAAALSPTSLEHDNSAAGTPSIAPAPLDPLSHFAALKSFYRDQIARSEEPNHFRTSSADLTHYSSPASLARLMSLYTGLGGASALNKANQKPQPMREALHPSEGLLLSSNPDQSEEDTYARLTGEQGFLQTTTRSQRLFQQGAAGSGNPHARFVHELRPMPALLRTKRAKRCKECKHILVKPEVKPSSTRYRIKLFALSYLPLVTLKPGPGAPAASLATASRPMGTLAGMGGDLLLPPEQPCQWIMTLKNQLFDPVQVSLGTPAITPGRFGHRVTLLCPQFEIGAKSEAWDDASDSAPAEQAGGKQTAEAGKVYEKGNNWASVVIEIVPASLKSGEVTNGDGSDEEDVPGEDQDVLEIPIRVRLVWRQTDVDEAVDTSKNHVKAEGEEDEAKREVAYWMVLGIGRIGAVEPFS